MTDERTPERDQRREDDSLTQRPAPRDEDQPAGKDAQQKPKNPNPWTREGADAPDAADIEDPREQR